VNRFLCKNLRSSWLRSPLVTLGFTLLLAAPAYAQGTSPWENAVDVLMTAFTSTIARGLSLVAIVVAGLTFAFGSVERAEFTWLREKTEATDGNLRAQLLKLEEAGYVAVEKKFVLRKPQSLYRITETGRQALTEYVQALKQLLGPAIAAQGRP
jgi:type IV secretory pathway VirB2 component (pilin)